MFKFRSGDLLLFCLELLLVYFFFSIQVGAQSKEISSLETTVAALREDYERCLSANASSQRDLQENLISSKHELLRVQEQLALAEKVRCCWTSVLTILDVVLIYFLTLLKRAVHSGVGEKVPADCSLSKHERNPD